MKLFKLQSIRSKLTLLMAVGSGVALLIACLAFGYFYVEALRTSKVQNLTAIAEVLASNSTAALSFQQAEAAEDLLASLENRPTIAYASILDMDGIALARYNHNNSLRSSPGLTLPTSKAHNFTDDGHLKIIVPVVEDGEQLGVVYLYATLDDVSAQIRQSAKVAAIIIIVCLGIAIALAYKLQKFISSPILSLADTAERISKEGDYSIRVARHTNDEIGVLYEHFNHMLQYIQDSEAMLREARDQLEVRVEERTKQLQQTNVELHENMTQRDQAIFDLEQTTRIVKLLQEVTEAANEAERTDTAIMVALKTFATFANWSVGHAYLPDKDNPDELVDANLWYIENETEFGPLRKKFTKKRVSKGSELPGVVLESAQPKWSSMVSADSGGSNAESPHPFLKSSFAFPILDGSQVVAVFEFFFTSTLFEDEKSEADFRNSLIEVATSVGNQLGRVFERQSAASRLEDMHRKVLTTARQAGMAEVATGVLHNVGNVLNSVNVSCGIIDEHLRSSGVANLNKATDMLKENQENIAQFITEDERGKHLTPFLMQLSGQMLVDETNMLEEVNSLRTNIEHIKDIISVQQSNAKLSGFVQEAVLEELFEDAIRVNGASVIRHGIKIAKEFDEFSQMASVDKQKIMQILVNLTSNAKHALSDYDGENKQITFRMKKLPSDRVSFEVADNGIGITKENQTKIFSHGFTTKKEGHGFGLHGAALFAEEMGGSLTLHSDGHGKGASFILEIPVKYIETAVAN